MSRQVGPWMALSFLPQSLTLCPLNGSAYRVFCEARFFCQYPDGHISSPGIQLRPPDEYGYQTCIYRSCLDCLLEPEFLSCAARLAAGLRTPGTALRLDPRQPGNASPTSQVVFMLGAKNEALQFSPRTGRSKSLAVSYTH